MQAIILVLEVKKRANMAGCTDMEVYRMIRRWIMCMLIKIEMFATSYTSIKSS